MKRVALVVNTLSSGGAERVVSNLSRVLADRYQTDIVLNDDVNICYPYTGKIISVGMPADSDRMKAGYQLKVLTRRTLLLRRLKKERRYAAVISFSDNTNLSNVLSGRKYGKTIVSVRYSLAGLEADEHRVRRVNRMILRVCCALADTVVSCSGEIMDEVAEYCGSRRDKLKVIYNGVDAEAFSAKMAETAAGRTGSKDKSFPHIVTIGRMSEQKAQKHLLYALKELRDRETDVRLTILGDGSLRKRLEDLCDELGIRDLVSMPGWVSSPAEYLAIADAAVFTSAYEGFCNAIVETLACGVPCISTDHRTGAREILAPGTDWNEKVTDRIDYADYGVLVPVNADTSMLADAVEKILTDTELAEKYRKAGPERAKQLSLKTIAEQWAEIIEEGR